MLIVCFGPFEYDYFDEAHAKLRLTDMGQEYQVSFERLVAHVQNWLRP
jgi:hypothetical protein